MAAHQRKKMRGLVMAALAVGSLAMTLEAANRPARAGAINRSALDAIPRNLTEIGWDTDVPALFVVRFEPGKLSTDASWSSWAMATMLQRSGAAGAEVFKRGPWPSIFLPGSPISTELSATDMQLFQAWCLRRSQVIPPVLVHSVPYVAPMDASGPVVVRPFGLPAGQPKASQVAIQMGFADMVGLALAKDAGNYEATVPPEVIAALPIAGVTLESRVRWLTPYPNSDLMSVQAGLIVPAEPVSLRLVDPHRRILWEHRFEADDPAPPEPKAAEAPSPVRSASPAASSGGAAPDIRF